MNCPTEDAQEEIKKIEHYKTKIQILTRNYDNKIQREETTLDELNTIQIKINKYKNRIEWSRQILKLIRNQSEIVRLHIKIPE